jgi:D-serine deaminase-like pyridoxal phosphate-dependent protein
MTQLETDIAGSRSVETLETPCLLIDRPRLARNLQRVKTIAKRAGVRLRPHVKTHKSTELARLQLEAGGASGLTASKPDEALVFIEAGAPSITVAYPVLDRRKLDRLAKAAYARGTNLNLIADSLPLVEAAQASAVASGTCFDMFMKVDVGLHRVGVDPTSAQALAVAQAIAGSSNLQFRGLISHAGHAYAASGRAEIAAIAEEERRILLTLAETLDRAGRPPPEISVGSTPTVLAAEGYEGLTEIRPGNYVFMDGTVLRLGLAKLDEVALTVRVTVLSRNDRYLIVDAGSKVLSSDKGAHGTGDGGFGRAYRPGLTGDGLIVERLSEEHGWIAHGGADVHVGEPLEIVPNHACVVTNLVGKAWVVEAGSIVDRWTMQARGAVL